MAPRRTWDLSEALPKRKVASPRYRKYWDGSRPQVWMVQPAELSAKGVGRGTSAPSSCRSQKTPKSPAESRSRKEDVESMELGPAPEPEASEQSWPEVRSNLWSISSAPSRRKEKPWESSLSTTSQGTKASMIKGSKATASQETDKSKVVPPWGPERANQDRRDVVVQKRLEYRQLLDEQNAKMADQHRQQRVEQAELEKNSIPSLATKTHEWEKHSEGDWKALMKEQLAAAACRRGKEMKQREEEQRSCREHLDQAAKERALRYYSTRRRLKEEVCELTEEWMKVSEEKRRLKDQQRRKDLDLEQKALEDLMAGMAPPRRLRKPVSLCDYYPEPKTIR